MNASAKKISTTIGISLMIQAVLFFGCSILASNGFAQEGIEKLLFLIVASLLTSLVPAVFIHLLVKNKIPRKNLHVTTTKRSDRILLTAGSAALMFAVGVIYERLFPSASSSISVSFGTPIYMHIIAIIAYALIPAVVEELFFRYTIGGRMAICGKATAVIISSTAFALAHFSADVFPYAFISGVILGILYFKTGSVLCTIIAHFFNNFTVYLFGCVKLIFNSTAYTAFETITTLAFFVVALVTVLFNSNFTLNAFSDDEDCAESVSALTPMLVIYGAVAAVISIL